MSHLLAISVGPVQEFIAAARRTRDLWLGSHLLSEVSKAVARSLRDQGALLIFPHPQTVAPGEDETAHVANVILAELPSGDPSAVAAHARQAAQQRWLQFAQQAWDEARAILRQELWDAQVADVLEFYAAWVPRCGSYRDDRRHVMRLLAGRKNLRDFAPAVGRAGVPKSSLDGQRESVLTDPAKERWPCRVRAALRLREGEQLDVVGLVKRAAGGVRPYPSVARIAADPWVRGQQSKAAFQTVYALCDRLPPDVLHRLDARQFPQFAPFPFEGTALYPSRFHEWQQETEWETQETLTALRSALKALPEVSPYLAVLIADGDGMGAAIANLPDADANREFSRMLDGFARQAHAIVQQHHGVLVYAGGDDVLALVPVDQCLACARQLHDDFAQRLAAFGRPTLSVGIAIAHFLENLEDLLEYGRAAERMAKAFAGKDALAVRVHPRSGTPVAVCAGWNGRPDHRWTRFAELLRCRGLPAKLPYDLSKLAALYAAWDDAATLPQALQRDVRRVIRDKQPKAGRAYLAEIEHILEALACPEDLRRMCDELLVARHLAWAMDQAQAPWPSGSPLAEALA
jgi:CRISPR-associated protein Cmr2